MFPLIGIREARHFYGLTNRQLECKRCGVTVDLYRAHATGWRPCSRPLPPSGPKSAPVFETEIYDFPRDPDRAGTAERTLLAQLDDVHSDLRLNYEIPKGLISLPRRFVAKPTLCETARRSEDRLQDHPAVRDERHEETQHAA